MVLEGDAMYIKYEKKREKKGLFFIFIYMTSYEGRERLFLFILLFFLPNYVTQTPQQHRGEQLALLSALCWDHWLAAFGQLYHSASQVLGSGSRGGCRFVLLFSWLRCEATMMTGGFEPLLLPSQLISQEGVFR